MRLNTPGGTPASCMTLAQRIALNGEYSEGFSTMVQPAASAGTTFAATWFIGQFQGVISAHTPTGSMTRRVVPRRSSNLKVFSTSIMALMCPTPMRGLRALGERDGRAHLGGDGLGDLVVVRVVGGRECARAARAALRAGARIAIEGAARGGDGALDVLADCPWR